MASEYPDDPNLFQAGDTTSGAESMFALNDLLNGLHGYLDSAVEFDRGSLNKSVKMGDAADKLHIGYYVLHDVETGAVPADCSQLEFQPRIRNEYTAFLRGFFLRFVELPAHAHDFEDGQSVRANDVLLALQMINGNEHRYVINAHPKQPGITPYEVADDLRFDPNELADRRVKKPNIYTAEEAKYRVRAPLSVETFRNMLQSSTPIPQSIDD